MRFTFYLVDENQMPTESTARTDATTPAALAALIRLRGGLWSTVDADVEQFADAFETLDRFAGNQDFLPKLALSGSPNFLLAGYPGRWRLGYFEASLVPELTGAFRLQSSEIERAMDGKDDATERVYSEFLAALDDARERKLGVAIVHE